MVPVITDFVMSCRIMGKNIEYALVEDMEADLRGRGTCPLLLLQSCAKF